jgi:signal transduction histidine kinase
VRRLRAWALDAFLVLLAAGEAASVLAGHAEEKPLAAGVSALSALVLIGRRRQPLAASIAAFALTALAITAVVPITTAQFFGILATFAITGAINAEREAVVAWLAGALMLAYGTWHAGGPGKASDYALTLAFATTLWAAGLLVRRRSRDTRAAVLRAEAAERDRQEQARRAVAEERARIARELHDVVSHGLSVIVLQTMAARAGLADAPAGDDVDRHLDAVEEIARESLGEMRRMLDLLQADDLSPAPDAPDAPAPGLAALPALLERAAAAGVHVSAADLAVDGTLPSALELSVYRVVQESLTNAVKHAPGSTVAVAVRSEEPGVVVTVTNTPGTGRAAVPAGAGHGLVGMRQRTGLYGGGLDAGPTPDGGFAVRATFPVEDEADPQPRRRRFPRREATA